MIICYWTKVKGTQLDDFLPTYSQTLIFQTISQGGQNSKKMHLIFFNPIKAGRFSGGDQLVSELWEVKTSKTHVSQTDNVPSFNLSP